MKKLISICAVVLMASSMVSAVDVDFGTFNIRNNNSTTTAPWDSDMSIVENVAGDGFSASTPRSGQKVGYGTNAFDGVQINMIQSANFTKLSGKAGIVPYLNMWVTDGTNYAIISSENDYRGTNFAARQEWKVFEYNTAVSLNWLFDSGTGARDGSQYLTKNGTRVTLADISSNIKLVSFTAPFPSYVGTVAPRAGYGFNVIFGDTQSNFIGSYALEDLSVTVGGTVYNATPEPATMALLGLGGLLLGRRK